MALFVQLFMIGQIPVRLCPMRRPDDLCLR